MARTTHNNPEAAPEGILVIQQKPASASCWSCGAMRAAHFCQECGKVQPPAPVDYFAFFGLPYRLNIDTGLLEREFYALSRHLHPDINAISSEREQDWSLEKSSQLNDAYRTLKDPISRTEYLLRLQGYEFEEQSKAATDEARRTGEVKKQVVPPDLLEEVFELNMQLEEMRMNRKMGEQDAQLEQDLRNTKAHLQSKYDELMSELKSAWDEWDALIGKQENSDAERKPVLDQMLGVLNRRSYLRNLLRDVDEVLES